MKMLMTLLLGAAIVAAATSCATAQSVWTERIRNGDGTMNWTEYENVATHAGELAQRDYLLGPKYEYYHPQPETFPTLALQGDADGWEGIPITRSIWLSPTRQGK